MSINQVDCLDRPFQNGSNQYYVHVLHCITILLHITIYYFGILIVHHGLLSLHGRNGISKFILFDSKLVSICRVGWEYTAFH